MWIMWQDLSIPVPLEKFATTYTLLVIYVSLHENDWHLVYTCIYVICLLNKNYKT